MDGLNEVAAYLPEDAKRALLELGKREPISNVRLYAGRKPRAQWPGGDAHIGAEMSAAELRSILANMLSHSLYAWEDQLGEGFFTLPGGVRAGVCGRFARADGKTRLAEAGSVCLRIAREVPGCAEKLAETVLRDGTPKSAILLSGPGMGKTTLLRDAIRLFSEKGYSVGIADERGEIAACRGGVPTLNVGDRSDVAEGTDKSGAIRRLIRTMSPDIVAMDELDGGEDALAVREAARMGVCVCATAHAEGVNEALSRPALRKLMAEGAFSWAFELANPPGTVKRIWTYAKGRWESEWTNGEKGK